VKSVLLYPQTVVLTFDTSPTGVGLKLVVSGTATVEVKGKIADVPAGSAFLLDSREAHIVHNRSRDIPLMVFSAYWMPR